MSHTKWYTKVHIDVFCSTRQGSIRPPIIYISIIIIPISVMNLSIYGHNNLLNIGPIVID